MQWTAIAEQRRDLVGMTDCWRSWKNRPMKLLFCSFLCFLSSFIDDADGACFRRYDRQTKACKGLLFSRPDIEPLLCCEKYGQGFAQVILRVENRKKWYECESCKGLNQSLRESNPSSDDHEEFREEDDDGDGRGRGEGRRARQREVEMNGGKKWKEEKEGTTRGGVGGGRPMGSSSGSRQKELYFSQSNGDSKDLTRAQREEEEKTVNEEEEEEEDVNVKELKQTMENREEKDEEEEEEEEMEEEMEEEEEEEGIDSSNSVEHNETSVSVEWSPWSDWSPCSHSCGVGVQKRRRFCLTQTSCGEEFEERACQKMTNCPVAGGWNAWTSWTHCTVSCGNGTRTRMRPCLSPPPSHGGINCQGPSMEKELCFLPPCKVDGAWSAWSLWSVCSVTCGRGEQVRTRSCDEPEPAHGGKTCDGSTEERRDCDNPPCPVDGGWSNWSKWSNCSAMCGEGVQTRSRTCDSPMPDHGGQMCDGPDRESMPCVTRINCPVDGNWTEWSRWDICSAKPCSGQLGHRVRYRTCTNPRPMFGGRSCRGRTWSRQACYNNDFCIQPVDGGWCDWVDWSSCAVDIQTRSRLCECPPPVNGGQDCPGINVEEKSCQSTDDVIGQSSTAAPPIPNETEGTTHSQSRDCADDESGDGSDVACADERDEEISADHSESTPPNDDDDDDQRQHKT